LKARKPKRQNKPYLLPSKVNGRCRMHGGLCTGPKSPEGHRHIAESNRLRNSRSKDKRGIDDGVTQQGMSQ
jgi:hypothetical protein